LVIPLYNQPTKTIKMDLKTIFKKDDAIRRDQLKRALEEQKKLKETLKKNESNNPNKNR